MNLSVLFSLVTIYNSVRQSYGLIFYTAKFIFSRGAPGRLG